MEVPGFAATDGAASLLSLSHGARHAKDAAELEFMAVNGSHALAPYRQAVLWTEHRKVCALSGVVQLEANAPYVHWLERVCPLLSEPGPVAAGDLPQEPGEEWDDWLPAYGLWLPFGEPDAGRGGLLLARDIPWLGDEISLLTEWIDVWHHAWKAAAPRVPLNLSTLRARIASALARERAQQLPRWRRRSWQVAAGIFLLLCIPVRLTVLAPGELVPANPAVVRSPLEGVIERFHIKPNQVVQKGQPLFDFDEAQLAARYAVALQSLATAEAEYRQVAQQALADSKFKSQLATLQGKIEERRAEAEFMRGQNERARVLAPQAGVVLLDDPGEWMGRPVAVGERVLRIADPQDVEVEAWLPVGDAIPIVQDAPASLYLSASPLDPVAASVRYVAYDAVQRPDGSYAYRVRARLDEPTTHRVGLKGTAKLNGRWAPLAYWILRRPLAIVRQTLGW